MVDEENTASGGVSSFGGAGKLGVVAAVVL